MFQQTIIIKNKFFGNVLRPDLRIFEGTIDPPYSLFFFCRTCGEVFARCPVTDPAGEICRWQAVEAVCEECPAKHEYEVPGCIWLLWDDGFNFHLPERVMLRELKLLLNFIGG